jgi:hypothetical protein
MISQMEKSEQRFVIKFLFLESLGAKAIHRELSAVLGHIAYSLVQVREWRSCFASGDLSCQDQFKTGRPFMFWRSFSPISLRNFLSPAAILSKMAPAFALRVSKNGSGGNGF